MDEKKDEKKNGEIQQKKKGGWGKTAAKFILPLILIGLGYILAIFVAQPIATEYKSQCEAIDKNLSMCVSNFELQKDYYLQLEDSAQLLANQTQYMTNKNFEFGNYICDNNHNGDLYFPNMSVPYGKIQCYGQDLSIKEYPIR